MKSTERRKKITELLASEKKAISGSELSERFGVSRQIIVQDIAQGKCHVCCVEEDNLERIVGVFYYDFGHDIDATYRNITDGAWLSDAPYGVVHRIASDVSIKGVGTFCINWAFAQSGHLRIDPHGDNVVMQNLMRKLDFTQCGTIYLEDGEPRIGFQKIC